eukprot:7210374-Alexandrium_andersonii.AAC.1
MSSKRGPCNGPRRSARGSMADSTACPKRSAVAPASMRWMVGKGALPDTACFTFSAGNFHPRA